MIYVLSVYKRFNCQYSVVESSHQSRPTIKAATAHLRQTTRVVICHTTNKVTATPSSTPTSGLGRMTPRTLDSEFISMWLMLVWGLLKSHGSQTTNMIDINVIQVNGNRQTEIINYCILPTTPPGNKHWCHSLSACDRLTYQGERATWPKCLHKIKMHNEKSTIKCFFTLIICCEYS